MKTALISLLTLLGVTLGSHAHAYSSAAVCTLEFDVSIGDIVIIKTGAGTGHVICTSLDGRVVRRAPVVIDILGFGLGVGAYHFIGGTGNIGILDPREIEGDYVVVDANVGAIAAAGANLGFKGERNGLSFTGDLRVGVGLGAGGFLANWRIRLAPPTRYERRSYRECLGERDYDDCRRDYSDYLDRRRRY